MNISSNGSSISMSGGSMGGSKNGFMNLRLCFKKFNRNYGSESGIDFLGQRRSGIINLL